MDLAGGFRAIDRSRCGGCARALRLSRSTCPRSRIPTAHDGTVVRDKMACTALVGLAPLRLSARRASSADTRSAKLVVRAAATERANEDGKKIARASLAALAVRLPPRGPSPFRHALASRARAACARRERRAMRLAPGDQFPRVPRGLWTRSAGSYPRPPRLTTSTPSPPSPPPHPRGISGVPRRALLAGLPRGGV